MKQRIMSALDGIGMGNILRRAKQKTRETLSASGVLSWKPLVPETEFKDRLKDALGELLKHVPTDEMGDYLEFGVSRGTSMASAFHAFNEKNLKHVRLIGFDSFEGMPEEAEGQGWKQGEYKSTISATRRYLASRSVDFNRVQLIQGWFKDTFTNETRELIQVQKASVIMVDCDIYTASKDALNFALPYISERVIMIFDDWGWREDESEIGQKEAFQEFLNANSSFKATPLKSYLKQARMFLIERA